MDAMIGELGCGGIRIGVGVVVGVMVDISRRWICIATVVALGYSGSSVRVEVGSVVRCWCGGVVETRVLLWCLPARVSNFKISKYFNTSFTYDGLVNADISAFTLDHVFVNAEISAFTNLHTAVICVNAEIPAFTRPNICECRNICMHESKILRRDL